METSNLQENVNIIKNGIGPKNPIVVKNILIGSEQPLEAVIIYISGLVDNKIINDDLLQPLMFQIHENLNNHSNLADYICKRYISVTNTELESDINNIVCALPRGKTALLINGLSDAILLDTAKLPQRAVEEPRNEVTIRGSREGFIEDIEVNISILRRRIPDKNLAIEKFRTGVRSQTDGAILYIQDIADPDIVNQLKDRINSINVDEVISIGMLQQYIEKHAYSMFPQVYTTERPDVIEAHLMAGKVAVTIEGTPTLITVPTGLMEFFQAVGDYYERTIVSSFIRILRFLAACIVLFLPSLYLILLKFNAELIPIKFLTPIIESRTGIAFTPFAEIVSMQIIGEFLREGGLRLPGKIGQTISVIGGIIIGDAALKAKIVSPSTLFVIGVAIVSSFLIPNYDMASAIRILQYPMLISANILGIYGVSMVLFALMIHLFSLDSFGAPYLEFKKNYMKDIFIRAPLWKFNKRPENTPNINPIRQTDFRSSWNKESKK